LIVTKKWFEYCGFHGKSHLAPSVIGLNRQKHGKGVVKQNCEEKKAISANLAEEVLCV
jgi:hypothetical protein